MNIFNFDGTNRLCNEDCVFRQIVLVKSSEGYLRLRCVLLDIIPFYTKCVLSYTDYCKCYATYSVIDGELKIKSPLVIV